MVALLGLLLDAVIFRRLADAPEAARLVGAIGVLIVGRQYGWRVMMLVHSPSTIRKYMKILGIRHLREVLPDNTMLPKMSRNAAKDICLLTNPRPAGWKDILNIYYGAW